MASGTSDGKTDQHPIPAATQSHCSQARMNPTENTSMPIDPSPGNTKNLSAITKNFNKPSTDDPQPLPSTNDTSVGETDPPPSHPPPSKMAAERCEPYISLNSKIKDQCTKYHLFHPNQQFGAFPDMYKPHHTYPDEKQPKETSHFFRGGIITTIAVFEAFIVDLLKEARSIAKQHGCHLQTEDKNVWSESDGNKIPKVLFHAWDMAYHSGLKKSKTKLNPLTDYLLKFPMEYHYVIKDEKISTLEIGLKLKERSQSDDVTQRRERRQREKLNKNMVGVGSICAILKLFYGIRCVMAHGDAKLTLESQNGALKNFPCCDKSCFPKETQVVLEACKDLEHYCTELLKAVQQQDKRKEVEKKIGRVPHKDNFEFLKKEMDMEPSLTQEEWKDCFDILDQYFAESAKKELAAPFAFFHMCHVERWLRQQKKDMYITYRMLVRINQFIHTLALQLTLAVANILMDVHKLPDGFWAIELIRRLFHKQWNNFF